MYSVVGADGQTYGPVSLDTLKQWCSQGRVIPTSNLIAVGTGQIMRASDLHELQPYFQSGYGAASQTTTSTQAHVHHQQQGQVFQQPYMPSGPTPFSAPHYQGQPGAFAGSLPKKKSVAAILAFVFGPLGIHRFYLGYTREGIMMLGITLGSLVVCQLGVIGTSIWSLIDAVKILTDSMPDANGQRLV
jgi:TM2 domain-containing membrane protein YozV